MSTVAAGGNFSGWPPPFQRSASGKFASAAPPPLALTRYALGGDALATVLTPSEPSLMSADEVMLVSEQDSEDFFMLLSKAFTIVMVLMCVCGVLMNSLSLWIFTRRVFRHQSINVLLAGLSASDVCLCLLAIPVFSLNQLQQLMPGVIGDAAANRLLIYAYPITLMAQTSSVWMLVNITIDRWLAVCHPFAVRIYCTRTRAVLTIVGCVLFSVGYNFVRFWEYTIEEVGDQQRIVGLLRDNHYYMVLYQNIALLLTQFVLPLLVLGVLNLQVARAILEASETRRVLITAERREHRTAKMMLFVVIVFLFCYALSFCLNLLEIFNSNLFKQSAGFMLNDVNNVLVVINSSSSFIFYTRYSSRFRMQLGVLRDDLRWFLCRYFCCPLTWWVPDAAGGGRVGATKRAGILRTRKTSSMTLYSGVPPSFLTANNSSVVLAASDFPHAQPLIKPTSSPEMADSRDDSTVDPKARKNSDFAASIIHQNGSTKGLNGTASSIAGCSSGPITALGGGYTRVAPDRTRNTQLARSFELRGREIARFPLARRWQPLNGAPVSARSGLFA